MNKEKFVTPKELNDTVVASTKIILEQTLQTINLLLKDEAQKGNRKCIFSFNENNKSVLNEVKKFLIENNFKIRPSTRCLAIYILW